MTKIKYITILVLFFSSIMVGKGNTNSDTLNSFNSFKLLRIKNHWLNSNNLAGIALHPLKTTGEVGGGYRLSDGDYHRLFEASRKNEFSLFTESYQRIKSVNFYGKFKYQNSNETGNLYSGVYDPYSGNPYIIGDSVRGANYHKESFQLSGGAAKKLTDNFTAGILAEYFVGVGANQKDPRPLNIVTDIKINPSFILEFSKIKIGFDFGYQNRKEDIDYKQVVENNPDPAFFMFRGLGFYNAETGSDKNRFYNKNIFLGGIQFESLIFNWKSLSEIRGNYSLETTEDGSSVIKKADAGDWKTYTIELNQQFTRQDNNTIKKLTVKGSYFNGDGIEHNQKKITNEDNASEYITLSKNLKYNRTTLIADVKFDLINLQNSGDINWETTIFSSFRLNNEKYYYIPEVFKADFSNIEAGFKLEKNFYPGKFHWAPELSISYCYNISDELYFSSNDKVKEGQNQELFMIDYNYYLADYISFSGYISAGAKTVNSNFINELFIKTGYEYLGNMETNKTIGIITAKLGFIF